MRLLTDVDGDEVSLVKRAANRRRFLLLKGDDKLDAEISDLLEVPWEREGALLDEVRKDGTDETVEKAIIAAVRLLKGVESELSRETVEKLGTELYGRKNPKLNTSAVDAEGGLTGSESGDDMDGSASGASKDGSASGADLEGSGSAPKVAADGDDDEPDDDADDMDKADFSADERKSLASRGQALPDGSYPIRNKSDLSNAIQAFGRAKDKGRAKAWIIRRAKALGATNMLPDSWNVSKQDLSDPDEHDDERGTVEVQVPVKKEDGTWDLSGVPEESRPFFQEMIQKADKTESELEKTRDQLAKADDALLTRSMVEKAAAYSHVAATDDLAPILKECSQSLDAETFEKLEGVLKAAEERIEKGDLFTEMGRSSAGDPPKSDAYSQLVAKADELIEKDGDMTKEQAFDRAMRDNPALYDQYMADMGMGVR